MCGLAGFVDFSGRPASQWIPALERMHEVIAHRGPDGWGRLILDGAEITEMSARGEARIPRAAGAGPSVGLAHARLAIIDLSSGGHQPMAAGRGWIAYNGEIYNYRPLRDQLLARGRQLKSTSDTEVLAELLARDGAPALSQVRGMFAFAWWDDQANRLLLARDRFGIKPLVYAEPVPGLVLFASEPRALLSSGLIAPEPRSDRAAEFFARGSVDVSANFWNGVQSVAPGTCLEFHAGGVARHEYWSLEHTVQEPAPEATVAAVARIARDGIVASVEAHLVSDVPVAIFLSGGIDSTAVLAAAREVTGGPLQTFTVSMPGARLDESAAARETARRFGSEHLEVALDGLDVDQALDEFFAAMQTPSVDGFNTFLVARAARRAGVRVALSGVGGDELFGGYESFVGVPRVATLASTLGPFGRLTAPLLHTWPSPRTAKLGHILSTPARSVPEIWWEYRRLFAEGDVMALTGRPGPAPPAADDASPAFSSIRQLEIRHFLEPQLLGDADAFTMCGALELRTPLVDHVLIQQVVQAGVWARRAGESFKQTLFRSLPELTMPPTVDRPKQGFVLPYDTWIRTALTDRSPAQLPDFKRRLSQPRYAPFVRRFLAGRLHWSRLWAIYVYERFAADNVEGKRQKAEVRSWKFEVRSVTLIELTVLIVTYNSRRHVDACLASLLRALDGIRSEVAVIDNGSSDGTAEYVRERFPAVRVIALPKNRGFAAGINEGLAATSGRYVMWLNPDATFVSGQLREVLAWMDAHPEVGIVGGRILDPEGTVQRSARAFPSYGAVLGARYSLLTKLFPNNPFSRRFLRTHSSNTEIEPVDWVSGAFLIHTRALGDQLGGPDEGFFMYFEDVDFCSRAWRAGSRVFFHPGITSEHRIGGSSAETPAALLAIRHRSLWRWYTKHFRRLWIKDAVVWLGIWTRCGALVLAAVVRRSQGPRVPGSGETDGPWDLGTPGPLDLPRAATSMPKRLLDIVFAATGLLMTWPLWLVLAALITLEDRGPVFFRQERSGLYGRPFDVLKFRSMRPDAERLGARQAVRHDRRVTRIGRLMRATALDELPQFWNILRGEMSVVGPRSLRPGEIEAHGAGVFERLEDVPGFAERARVRPGLTGLAQLYAPRNLPRRQKFRYDKLYIRAYSFSLDLRLILLSLWVSVSGQWERRGRPTRGRESLGEPAQRA